MRNLFSMITLAVLLVLPGGAWAQDSVATAFTGEATIPNPGINGVPCGPNMPRGDCPGFTWKADKTVTGSGVLWGSTAGSLPFASCAGNVHQSTMTVQGTPVSYTAVCVGLNCSGGGAWGTGAFGADLIFVVTASEGAKCLSPTGGFNAAGFNGGAIGGHN